MAKKSREEEISSTGGIDIEAIVAKERDLWLKAIRSLRPKEVELPSIKISTTAPSLKKHSPPPLIIPIIEPAPILPSEVSEEPLLEPTMASLPEPMVEIAHPVEIKVPQGRPMVSAMIAEELQEQVQRLTQENMLLQEQAAKSGSITVSNEVPTSGPTTNRDSPLEGVRQELEEVHTENRHLREQVEALREASEALSASGEQGVKIASLEADNSALRIQLDALQRTLDELMGQPQPTPKKMQEMETQNQELILLKARKQELEEEAARHSRELAVIKETKEKEVQALLGAQKELREIVARLTQDRRQLEGEQEVMRREAVQHAQDKNALEQRMRAEYETRIRQITDEAKEGRAVVQGLHDEMKRVKEFAERQQRLAVKAALEEQVREDSEAVQTLQAQLTLHGQESQDIKIQLEQEMEILKIRFEKRLADERKKAQDKDQEWFKRSQQLTASVKQMEEQLAEEREALSEELKRRLQDQEDHWQFMLSQRLEEAGAKMEWMRKSREEELKQLRGRLELEIEKRSAEGIQAAEREAELQRVKAEAGDLQKLTERLRDQLTSLEQERDGREREWRQRVTEAENRLLTERTESQKSKVALEEQFLNTRLLGQAAASQRDQLEGHRTSLEQAMLAERARAKEAEEAFLKAQTQLKEISIEAREQEFALEKQGQELRSMLEAKEQELRLLRDQMKGQLEAMQNIRLAAERQVSDSRDQVAAQHRVVADLLQQQEVMAQESQRWQQEAARVAAQLREQGDQARKQIDEQRIKLASMEQANMSWLDEKSKRELELKALEQRVEMETQERRRREEELEGVRQKAAASSKSTYQGEVEKRDMGLKLEELTQRIDYLEKLLELKTHELMDLQKTYQQLQKAYRTQRAGAGSALPSYLEDLKKELGS